MTRFIVAGSVLLLLASTWVAAQPAPAGSEPNRPGSLLVYPLVSRTSGGADAEETLICVTNTNTDFRVASPTFYRLGDVRVVWNIAWVPITSPPNNTWSITDGQIILSPGDTFCAPASAFLNTTDPFHGFMWMYAADINSGSPPNGGHQGIDFDFLTGEALVVGIGINPATAPYFFSLPAIPFKSQAHVLAPAPPTAFRNVQGWAYSDLPVLPAPGIPNNRLDFDGFEYALPPDVLLQPFFLRQDLVAGLFHDEVVLLLLRADGADYTTNVRFYVFNWEENPSSADRAFTCWTRRKLRDLSSYAATLPPGQGPFPFPQPGQPGELPAGWFSVFGVSLSPLIPGLPVVSNPAILGAFVHRLAIGSIHTDAVNLWGDGTRPGGFLSP